ncbi:hypothetical protein ACLOJK_013466 [Asimina triloba]
MARAPVSYLQLLRARASNKRCKSRIRGECHCVIEMQSGKLMVSASKELHARGANVTSGLFAVPTNRKRCCYSISSL